MKSKEDLLMYLRDLDIAAKTYEHEVVYTVQQAEKICSEIPGGHVKNLFLKDKNGRFWLVVAKNDTKIDLKKLAKQLSVGRFSFGKVQELLHYLGVTSGGVTPFGLINDVEHAVNVVVEKALFDFDLLNFHPLTNDATTAISSDDFEKFLQSCGNKFEIIVFNVGVE